MAEKTLKGIKFPGLDDYYLIPQFDEAKIAVYVNNAIYGAIDGNIESISNDKVTYVRDYGYYQHQFLKAVQFPIATRIGHYSFYMCPELTAIDIPNTEIVGDFAFKGCPKIQTIDFPNATAIGTGCFDECAALSSINLPKVTSVKELSFRECSSLNNVVLPSVNLIWDQAFWGCSNLSSITLSANEVCTLKNVNAFDFTPIAEGTGYIYVPSNLVNTYKSTSNWSNYANQIRAIN